MIDYIRSQDWVPHRARSFQKKVDEAYSMLAHEKMREPEADEVADFLDIPVEKVEKHLTYMNHAAVLSFEAVLQDMTGDKERLVVSLYYYEELKYSEIAEIMGIGQSRVCQIHTKAMKKLKSSLEEYVRG